jgi:hypothetical protein
MENPVSKDMNHSEESPHFKKTIEPRNLWEGKGNRRGINLLHFADILSLRHEGVLLLGG